MSTFFQTIPIAGNVIKPVCAVNALCFELNHINATIWSFTFKTQRVPAIPAPPLQDYAFILKCGRWTGRTSFRKNLRFLRQVQQLPGTPVTVFRVSFQVSSRLSCVYSPLKFVFFASHGRFYVTRYCWVTGSCSFPGPGKLSMKKEKQTSSFQTFSLWWHIVPEIWNLFAWPSVTLLGSCFGIASVSKPRLVKSTCCSTWSRAAVPGCRTTAWQVRAGFPLNTL